MDGKGPFQRRWRPRLSSSRFPASRVLAGGGGTAVRPSATSAVGPASPQRVGVSTGESDRLLLSPSVCENGWRCCLINRDRKMPTDYIRNGVLYVTEK